MMPDMGFMKSSEISLSFGFSPFDRSQASSNALSSQKRDVMQLLSLLEACLHSNYMDRAFSILESLYMVKSHRPYFIEDYNMYFARFAESCDSIAALDDKLSKDLESDFQQIEYNEKTLAFMVHHALKFYETDPVKVESSLKTYFKMSFQGPKSILSHNDVLSVGDYKKIYNNMQLIKVHDLPNIIRPLLEEESSVITNGNPSNIDAHTETTEEGTVNSKADGSYIVLNPNTKPSVDTEKMFISKLESAIPQLSLDDSIKPLEKDARKLIAVDTIGMKVVRHTLLGLSLNEQQRENILKFPFEANSNILNVDEGKSIDFFDIYRSLKTEEEVKRFEDAMDDFNQDRQRALELRATNAAKERWRHDFEEVKARGDLSIEKKLNVKLWKWYSDMLPLVMEEVRQCNELINNPLKNHKDSKQDRARLEYAPYLTLVDPEKMCVITILELLKLNSTGGIIEGMRTARAVIAVGKAIEMEFRSEELLKSESHAFREVNKQSQQLKKHVRNARSKFRTMKIEQSKILWPQAFRAKVGSIMISNLIHIAKVDVGGVDPVTKQKVFGEVPAFSHGYQYHNGIKLGVLKIHKTLIHQLNGERISAAIQPQLLPMLVKPRPWTNWKSGGYYYTQSTLIRSKDSPEQIAYLKAVSEAGAIDSIYNGLNVLGDTPWTVNRAVFNVISEVWNSGKDFLDIPGIQEHIKLLPPPPREADPTVHREWKLKNKELANKFSSNRSVRCDSNYKLEIARAFLGEKIYFPHNLDFRGRAYPLSPHFNHLGNDMSRGLLTFWKGKRLGPVGFKWLKVHLSNLLGFDKAPLEERVSFVESHIEDLRDSADNPLTGKGWWKTADKPWQALATCIELNEALKLDNPGDFISHQPVHQDGTCNGLQHYAALGGDVEGATQVNLKPSERPMDVYQHVADLVAARLTAAAEKGDKKADILKDKITRKVVKQTVMTNVYGVTYVGATFQIDKQLSDIFDDRKMSLELSKYLTKHVFIAIRELFHGAHLIQDWLGECSKRISKSIRLDVDEKSFKNGNKPDFMSSVIWTTPLGLPIVQPYREGSKKQVKTNLQTIFISDPFSVNPVNARRQKAGFPPNFIHSLDASHMLLSASECGKQQLDFASVHDSYWTHACDIDTMNSCLREQFIKLHEVDLIERLKNEFDQRYKSYVQIATIEKSSDIAKHILKVRSKLSSELGRPCTLADEIFLEKNRAALTNSSDPGDIEEGINMVTTISITESISNLAEYEVSKSSSNSLPILVPLVLPEIPPKGDFDVEETRNSLYFFS